MLMGIRLKLFFEIISVNQLGIHGAVSDYCTRRIFFMSMFNDILLECEDNKKKTSQMLNSSHSAKTFGARHWSFLGTGSEKKW